jgi:ATP-dependent Zn protease
VRVSIAGKASEIEFCGMQNQTLGVAGDFANIQNILMNMAMAGMLGTLGGAARYSFDLMTGHFNGLTMEQSKAIEEAYQKVLLETRQALRERKEIVHALVELLLEKEEILSDEVRAFFDQYGLYTPDPMVLRDGEEISILPPSSTKKLPGGEQPIAGGD